MFIKILFRFWFVVVLFAIVFVVATMVDIGVPHWVFLGLVIGNFMKVLFVKEYILIHLNK